MCAVFWRTDMFFADTDVMMYWGVGIAYNSHTVWLYLWQKEAVGTISYKGQSEHTKGLLI